MEMRRYILIITILLSACSSYGQMLTMLLGRRAGCSTPAAIGGTGKVCTGLTTMLTDATPSGVWSSSNSALGSVDASTGVLAGIAAGNPRITYTVTGGCFVTKLCTVSATPVPTYIAGTACVQPPCATTCVGFVIIYRTQSGGGINSYVWNVPGVLNTDYAIDAGGTGAANNLLQMHWLTTGSKTVTVGYTSTAGCVSASPATNTTTTVTRPVATFTAGPGANTPLSVNTPYTTQSGQSSYVWVVPGTVGIDYVIISGGIGSTDSTVTLQWISVGSKTVTVNYSDANGCTSASAASNTTSVP